MKVTNKKIDKRKRTTIKRRVTERWVLKRKQNLSTGFDVHRAVHRNIISIVKPTSCASVSNLFYFGMTLYMFRTVFPSIMRISRLFDKCLLLYVQS